jgi:hypothetical protein
LTDPLSALLQSRHAWETGKTNSPLPAERSVQRPGKKQFPVIILPPFPPMKIFRNLVLLVLTSALFTGCVARSTQTLNQLHVGMTKAEVIRVMGPPSTVASQGGVEYLNYNLATSFADFDRSDTSDYFIRIVNGQVDAYGQKGDFDTTKNPTIDYNIKQEISTERRNPVRDEDDLYTKLRKLQQLRDDALISEEEFLKLKKQAIDNAR